MTMIRTSKLFSLLLILFVPLQLLSQLNADFTVAEDTICKGDTVQFFDQSSSSGTIVQYEWDFNGGEAIDSTVADPLVVYDSAEYDTITSFITELTVTDDNGNTDTQYKTNSIFVNDLPHPTMNMDKVGFWWGDTICMGAFDRRTVYTDPNYLSGTEVYGEAIDDWAGYAYFYPDSAGPGATALQVTRTDSLGCYGDTTYYTYIDTCNYQSLSEEVGKDQGLHIRYNGREAWMEPGSPGADLSGKHLELFTLQGRRIKAVRGRERLKMGSLSQGLYLLRSSKGVTRKVFVEGQ
jgi:hypothetical protein